MKLNEVTALGIRLLGIWLVLSSMTNLPHLINQSLLSEALMKLDGSIPDNDHSFIILWGTTIWLIASGLFLVKFPVTVAGWLVPRSRKDSPLLTGDPNTITIAGFTILGAYVLSYAVPDFMFNITELYHIKKYAPHDDQSITELWLYQFNTVIEIVVGAYLIAGANGLTKILRKLRA